jgi:secreted trypsin-like serine protease
LKINIDYTGLLNAYTQLNVTKCSIKLVSKSLGVFMLKKFVTTWLTSALLFIAGSVMAAKDPLTYSNKANNQIAETRIVGGEEAIAENWPWMTAYVSTFNQLLTSLNVNDVIYDTRSFTSGVGGQAIGEIVACGIGDEICADATNKVCLIERGGDINFSVKADNCETGGGIGAIIYNNEEVGNISGGTLGDDYTGTIPVISVTQVDGLTLLEQVGNEASLSVSETTELQQDSACGASFLGDKWVLTAAHCVDSANSSQFKMNVGEYDLSDGAENAIDIASIYIHPLYDNESLDNDIALIELVSSVDAPGVKIAEPEVTNQYATENNVATIAGWGGREGYAPSEGPTFNFPDILHRVDLQLSTNAECRKVLGESLEVPADNINVTDVMICAAVTEGGRGTCQGDSGGPLIVNTGSGVQQVGIVSWGFGCAEAGFPDVYTRVSEFKNWISAITEGVTVTQRHDFGLGFNGEQQTTELTVINNSKSNVGLSFELAGSTDFTLDTNSCRTLDAGTSCQIIVNYLPTMANEVSAELTITSDNDQVKTTNAMLSGTTLISAIELSSSVGDVSEAVTLFSGGSNGAFAWTANLAEGVESGTTGDLQNSILAAQIKGQGLLTFDWSVSSEENTDLEETDPDFEPYDGLYLYVNGMLIDYISGEVDFTEYSIDLAEGTNEINWTYNKDLNTADGEDKGFIRNLTFTPVIVTPPPVFLPTPVTKNSSGGGGLNWIILCLIGLAFRIRTKI